MTGLRWRPFGPGMLGSLPVLVLASVGFALLATRLPAPGGLALWNLDLPKIDAPLAVFFHDALSRGGLPLWNDQLGLGFPLYAEGQIGAFYPPNWLLYRLDPLTALDVTRLLHLTLAGVGTGLLAERLSGNRLGALLAAAVAILGGAIVTKLQWTNLVEAYAWLPWILLPLARRPAPTRAGLVIAASLFGLQALAGHPNTWLLTGLAATVLLLVNGRDLRAVGRVAVFGVVGVAVGAVQLLPTLLLTTLSVRQAGVTPNDAFTSSATVFDPLAFGFGQAFIRTGADGWDFYTAWFPDGTFALLETSAFVGLVVLGLAAIGARTRRARPWLVVAAVLLAIPVIAALRPDPWLHIPILNGLRSPVRSYIFVAWVIGLLAAIGVARVGRRRSPVHDDGIGRDVATASVAALLVAGWYLLVTGAAVSFPDVFAALFRSAANDGSPQAVAAARDLAIKALTTPLPVVAEMIAVVIALGLLAAAARRPDHVATIRMALVALAIIPLALLSPLSNVLRPVSDVWPVDSELAVALRAADPNRVLTLDAPGYYAGSPDRLAAAGVPDLDMFSSLNLAATDAVTERARHGADAELVRRLVGVDTLVTFGVPCPGEGAQQLDADAAVVCRVPARTGPYWIPADAITGTTDPAGVFGPRDVDLDLGRADGAAVDGVVEASAPGVLTATVDAPDDGHVWLGRAWWPAWKVEVDGRPVIAARALGGMLVPVTAGAHRISAQLVPFDALAGLLLGLVVLLAAVAWALRAPRRSSGGPVDPAAGAAAAAGGAASLVAQRSRDRTDDGGQRVSSGPMAEQSPSLPSASTPTTPTTGPGPTTPRGGLLGQLGAYVARRPNSVGTVLIVVLTMAVYLFTADRDRQDFDYFVRLADAFLHGRLYLLEAPSWLNELVPGGGGWYVVYPPVPAVLLMPLVALFGTEFPQQVASCLFGAISVGLMWLILGRFALTVRRRLILTLVFAFGTVLWYVAENGSAWYIGHASAVMFSAAAVLLALDRRWPVAIGLFLGLAAISRLPVALACVGVLMLLLRMGWPLRLPTDRALALRRTLGFGIGMAVPVALYFAYNEARWGTLLDQGYTKIPGVLEDPIYEKFGIFAIEYIPRHIYAIFLRSWNFVDDPPFFQPSWWGLGLFLTTPLLIWLVRARLQDPRVLGSVVATALVAIPIVTHGNVGLAQFGYRFSLDVQVFLFVILATVMERGMSRLAWLAALASIAICAYAIWAISIEFVAF